MCWCDRAPSASASAAMLQGYILFKGLQNFWKTEHFGRFCSNIQNTCQHILHWISDFYWHLAWNSTLVAWDVTSWYFLSHMLSIIFCFWSIVSTIFFLGNIREQISVFSGQGVTLLQCIWGSYGINIEQIGFFTEPKEKFGGKDILYQIIKGKEPLWHSCNWAIEVLLTKGFKL